MAQANPVQEPQSSVQKQLESLFNKYQTTSVIREYLTELGMINIMQKLDVDPRIGLDLMMQIILHKRASFSVLAGTIFHHFQNQEEPTVAVRDFLIEMTKLGFIIWDAEDDRFVVKFDLTEKLQQKLKMYTYPLPMLEHPRTVRNNAETGYLTIRGSLLLKQNHHDEDICLDHINRMNDIRLKLNPDIVAFVENQWNNLDKRKPGETQDQYNARKEAFKKFDVESRDVIRGLMAAGDSFWLTHKYDKRGRTYCQGYHVNYQGNDWCKAVVEFADEEPLNQE